MSLDIEIDIARCRSIAKSMTRGPWQYSADQDAIYSLIKAVESLTAERDALQARVAELDRDAGRYRWLRQSKCLSYTSDTGPRHFTPLQRIQYALAIHGKRTNDMIEIRLLCHHLGPNDEPIWIDGEHFDFGANMDAAIDAAREVKP